MWYYLKPLKTCHWWWTHHWISNHNHNMVMLQETWAAIQSGTWSPDSAITVPSACWVPTSQRSAPAPQPQAVRPVRPLRPARRPRPVASSPSNKSPPYRPSWPVADVGCWITQKLYIENEVLVFWKPWFFAEAVLEVIWLQVSIDIAGTTSWAFHGPPCYKLVYQPISYYI